MLLHFFVVTFSIINVTFIIHFKSNSLQWTKPVNKRGYSQMEFVQKWLTFVLWNWLTGSRSFLIWQRTRRLLCNEQKKNATGIPWLPLIGSALSCFCYVWPSYDPLLTAQSLTEAGRFPMRSVSRLTSHGVPQGQPGALPLWRFSGCTSPGWGIPEDAALHWDTPAKPLPWGIPRDTALRHFSEHHDHKGPLNGHHHSLATCV